MRIKSIFEILPTDFAKILALAVLVTTLPPETFAATPSDLLEKGIYNEETKGDLKQAAQLNQEIVSDPAADPGLVAQAQLRLGLCPLKMGEISKAVSALEQLTQELPDSVKPP